MFLPEWLEVEKAKSKSKSKSIKKGRKNMSNEDNKYVVQVEEAVSEIQKTLDESVNSAKIDMAKSFDEKFSHLEALDKEKVEKMMNSMNLADENLQEQTKKFIQSENEKKAQEERIVNLEKKLMTANSGSKADYKQSPEFKAINEWCRKGDGIGIEHKDYLRTDVVSQGAATVPESMAPNMLKELTEVSPVRALAKKWTIQTKTLAVPIRTTLPTATFEGEAEEVIESTPRYISEIMTAHRQDTLIPITRDILSFSAFDMTNSISSDAITAFAQSEGNKFILGTGVKQPQGILDPTANIAQFDSSASGVVSMDDVITLSGELKIGYNPVYSFNRKTLVALRVEKDANGNYLWRAGGESQPTEINGFKYVIMQDMPDIASDSLSVLFGDYFRGYNILDSLQMELIRDDLTRKKQTMVEFYWNRYLDGRVVLSEAFKILKTAT